MVHIRFHLLPPPSLLFPAGGDLGTRVGVLRSDGYTSIMVWAGAPGAMGICICPIGMHPRD